MPGPDTVLDLITQYGYIAIFLFNFFEGSLVVLLGGFLASQEYFNPFTVIVVVLLSDTIGNILYYALGKYIDTNDIQSKGTFLRRIRSASGHIQEKPAKYLILSKYTYSLGFFMQVGAGVAGVPLLRFFLYNLIGNISKTVPLIYIGYFFGSAYKTVNSYIGKFSIGVSFVIVVVLLAFYIHKKNYFRTRIQDGL